MLRALSAVVLATCALSSTAFAEPPLSPVMSAAVGAAQRENAASRSSWAKFFYGCPGSPTGGQRGSIPNELLFTRANAVDLEVLSRGAQIFGGFHDLIVEARREVLLQTYAWETSDPTRAIVAALRELEQRVSARGQREPVHVYLLVESSPVTNRAGDSVVKAEVAALGLDARFVIAHVASYGHTLFGSNHAKTLVVDGEAAIVTGANPQGYHDFDDTAWYDLGFTVAGDVARALRHDFVDAWACGAGAGGPELTRQVSTGAVRALLGQGTLPIAVVMRRAAEFYNNGLDNPQDQAFLAALDAARTSIDLQTPNLNDDALIEALARAAGRGVHVRVLLQKGFNDQTESLPGQGGTNDVGLARLREATGAHAANLEARWYAHVPGVLHLDEGERAKSAHAKQMYVDGQVAIVGSANMDTQSWNHSREVNLLVDSAEVTAAWHAQAFEPAFARSVPAE